MAEPEMIPGAPGDKMREEKDSLGTHPVPAGAYYGVQTQRAVENYPISGQRARPSLIEAYGLLKWAAARANEELGLLPRRVARAIQTAAREVADHKLDAQFVVDVYQAGAGVSFHMNVNEVIANRAEQILGGELGAYRQVHPNDHVNYGQSTNDTFPTAVRIAARLELDRLMPVLERCKRAFLAKGEEFDGILKSGRTHMQDAVPIRLGQEFAAYGVALGRAGDELRHAADGLLELGLGGSAVGTGLNTDPRYPKLFARYLADETGRRWTIAADLRAAMQSQLPLAVASSALRNLALEIIRISNDLRLLSSGPMTGFAEINLPALQPGSSIMPGKVNPVMPELAAMVSFEVVGNDITAALGSQAGQLELNVMMPAIAHSVLGSAGIMTNMLRVFTDRCVAGITANPERCRYYAAATLSQATALNPYIGYARAAELVKEALKTGTPIIDLARQKNLLSDQALKQIMDPLAMTEPRKPKLNANPGSGPEKVKPTRSSHRAGSSAPAPAASPRRAAAGSSGRGAVASSNNPIRLPRRSAARKSPRK
jgi:aspartate ammonia-lyase